MLERGWNVNILLCSSLLKILKRVPNMQNVAFSNHGPFEQSVTQHCIHSLVEVSSYVQRKHKEDSLYS